MGSVPKKPSAEQIAEVYRQYVALVRTRAKEIVPVEEMMADIVQDVFLAFVRFANKEKVEDAAKVLYIIATRVALRGHREWARTSQLGELDAKLPALDSRIRSVEQRVTFIKMLDTVHEDEAAIAIAYFVEGMTQDEIAAAMGKTQREISRAIKHFLDRAQKRASQSSIDNPVSRKGVQNG